MKSILRSVCVMIILFNLAVSAAFSINTSTGNLEGSRTIAVCNSANLQLPIKLTYSSDIKARYTSVNGEIVSVPERPSNVGLGFELELPFIERKVVGPADDGTGKVTYLIY